MRMLSKLIGQKPENKQQLFDPQEIARYYEHQNGSNDYLERYFEACSKTGSTDNFLKQNRFFTLYQAVKHVIRRQLPGDVAECGCWKGHSTYLMADLFADSGWSGKIWVFDSFEGGLSGKGANDRTFRGNTDAEATERQKLKFASDFDSVRQVMAPYPFVSLHKGWIPAVFDVPIPDETQFALVHIDVDLYQPTLDSLRFFYPRMVKGGIIVIDDYGSTTFPGSGTAVDEFLGQVDFSLFLEGHIQGAVLLI